MKTKPPIRLNEEQREQVTKNIGLALSAAGHMRRRYHWDSGECQSIAFEALCKAIYYFDPAKGCLSKFFWTWLHDLISKQIYDSRQSIIRTPRWTLEKPTDDPHEYMTLAVRAHHVRWIEEMRTHYANGAETFYEPMAREEPEPPTPTPLWEAIDHLPARSAYVLTERARGRTLAELGRELGPTKERIRQIELTAKRYVRRYIEARGGEK